MTKQEHINYWRSSSDEDWLTAKEIARKNSRKHVAVFISCFVKSYLIQINLDVKI